MPRRKKRLPSKPTGSVGPFSVSRDATGETKGSFDKIEFSRDKAGIEEHIADRFVFSINKGSLKSGSRPMFSHLKRNAEDDYDFSVMEGRQPAYLELTETISPSRIKERSGDPGHITYDPSEFAQEIHAT